MTSLLIRGGTIVRAIGDERTDILVEDGVIRDLQMRSGTPPKLLSADSAIDATGCLLFPGFIDTHVHFREPGYEHKATMETEARSACMGGVTTVCDMPNTQPPTISIALLRDKVERAQRVRECNISFFFGVTLEEHVRELTVLWSSTDEGMQKLREHCCGVKVYFDHSTGDQKASQKALHEAFRVCGEMKIPLVAHCEDARSNARGPKIKGEEVSQHSLLRPPESEERAISAAIELAARHETPLHIAHLSTKQGVALVRQAKQSGLSVTCEVAPHHLFLSIEDYAVLGARAKVNPPLRSREHGEALWHGIEEGIVDCIASDHAPHTLEEKAPVHALDAPSGVPGVETMIPLLLTVAAGRWPHPTNAALSKALRYADIRRLCFDNPNRIFSLKKQRIDVGSLADIILVKPREEWVIRGVDLHAKCGWTPYEGWRVMGKAMAVGRW